MAAVILEKRKPISLEKKEATFGNIAVNLNWTQKVKEGFFGGLFGGKKGNDVDLDLGCFVKLKNGDIHALQPLGRRFGDLNQEPFVKHSGDDRTGANSSGENLNINGTNWDQIQKVLVYTYIYEGVPAWSDSDAIVTINCPGHEPIKVEMGYQTTDKSCCALVLLENDSGRIKISKEVEFFSSQEPMDKHYGFGFKWQVGRK